MPKARIPAVDPPEPSPPDSVTAVPATGKVDTRTSRIFGRNLAASWGSRVVVLIVTFLITPILARGLGRELYGLWAVGYTLQSYFALTDGGVNGGLLRMVGVANANHDHARVSRYVATAAVFYTVLGFVVLAAVFLVRGVLDHLFGVPPSLETTANFLFVGMALSLVITNLGGVFLATLSGVEDVHTTSFINMFGSLLTSAGFVFALVVLHGSIAGLVVANVLTSVVTTIVAIVACKVSIRYLSLSPSLISINHLREIGSLSLFIYVSNMAAVVNSSVDKFMIAGIVSLASAGLYDLGLRLTIMVTTLSYLVGGAAFPTASRLGQQSADAFKAFYIRAERYLLVTAYGLAGLLFSLSPWVVQAWLGQGYGRVALVSRLLAIAAAGLSITNVATVALWSIKRTKEVLIFASWRLVMHIGLSGLLTWRFGMLGAITGALCSLIIPSFWLLWVAHRRLGVDHIVWLREAWIGPVVAAVSATLVTSLVMQVALNRLGAHSGRLESLGMAILGIVVYLVCYTAVAMRLPSFATEVRELKLLLRRWGDRALRRVEVAG